MPASSTRTTRSECFGKSYTAGEVVGIMGENEDATMKEPSYGTLATLRDSLEDILARMLALKREGLERKESSQLKELVTEASVMFVDLRQVNRVIMEEEEHAKVATEAMKGPVDHTTLQLHNLRYEKNYYLRAIKTAKEFRSKYPADVLVSEDEFFGDAPEELRADPVLREDPHKLMLQRLNFELYQRKELVKQRGVVEAWKKKLHENIASRRKFLGSLPSHLKVLKKASLAVQQQLGLSETHRIKHHPLSELLPPPLYNIYVQFLAYKEAFEDALELDIVGNALDAQALAREAALKEAGAKSRRNIKAKEMEEPEVEEESQRSSKRAKKSLDAETELIDSIYAAHPLSVVIHVFDDIEKELKLLDLRFEFLTKLKVVCAGIENTKSGEGDSTNLLANLFADDTGLDLPSEVGRLLIGESITFDEKRPSRPYQWAQHLGGLETLPMCTPVLRTKEGNKGDVGKSGDGLKTGTLSSLPVGPAANRQQHRVSTVLQQLRAQRKMVLQ